MGDYIYMFCKFISDIAEFFLGVWFDEVHISFVGVPSSF